MNCKEAFVNTCGGMVEFVKAAWLPLFVGGIETALFFLFCVPLLTSIIPYGVHELWIMLPAIIVFALIVMFSVNFILLCQKDEDES